MNILVVEDSEATRKLLEFLLSEHGHKVTLAKSVAEARAALARERPDRVVLDVALPDGSGVDVLAYIRATPFLRGVPVLITSGLEMNALGGKKTAVLSKPYEFPDLESALEALTADDSGEVEVPAAK